MSCEPADPWEDVGRRLLAGELGEAQARLQDALVGLESAAVAGEEISDDDVREARHALALAERLVEESVVPVAVGVDPWERPPEAPFSARRAWARPEGGGEE